MDIEIKENGKMGIGKKLVLASLVSMMMVVAFLVGYMPSHQAAGVNAADETGLMEEVLGTILDGAKGGPPPFIAVPNFTIIKIPDDQIDPVWMKVAAVPTDPSTTYNVAFGLDGTLLGGDWWGGEFGQVDDTEPFSFELDVNALSLSSLDKTHWIYSFLNADEVVSEIYSLYLAYDENLAALLEFKLQRVGASEVDGSGNGLPDNPRHGTNGIGAGEIWCAQTSTGALALMANLDNSAAKAPNYDLNGIPLTFDNVRIIAPTREMLGSGSGNANIIPDGDDAFIIVNLGTDLAALMDGMGVPGLADAVEAKQPPVLLPVIDPGFAQYVEISIIYNRADDGRPDEWTEIPSLPTAFPVQLTMEGLNAFNQVALFYSYPTQVGATLPITLTASADDEWQNNNAPASVADGSATVYISELCIFAPFADDGQYKVLTTAVTPADSGSVSPGGVYAVGATPIVSATANPGWAFVGWEIDGVPAGDANPLMVEMITDHTVVAVFDAAVVVDAVVPNAGPLNADIPIKIEGRFLGIPAQVLTSVAEAEAAYTIYFYTEGKSAVTVPLAYNASAPEIVTASAIYAVAPARTTSGQMHIRVVENARPAFYGDLQNAYLYTAGPILTDITPNEGTDLGGTVVSITGANLATVTGVYFGSVTPANRAPNVVAPFDTLIQVTTPPSTRLGRVNVIVQNAGASGTRLNWYTYRGKTLTPSVTPPGAGTTVPGGPSEFFTNSVASVNATANLGFLFSYWEINGIYSGPDRPLSVTMNNDKAVTAVFDPMLTLAVAADPVEGGQVTANPAQDLYAPGAVVTVTAVANPGYVLDHWTVNGVPDIGATSIDVVMDENKTVVAHFSPFNITAVMPNAGPLAGGTPVKIAGAFPVNNAITTIALAQAVYSLYFYDASGSVPLAFDDSVPQIVSADAVYAITPAWVNPATVSVRIIDKLSTAGTYADMPDAFTYTVPPTITLIAPNRGPIDGGTPVAIFGTALGTAHAVYFGPVFPANRAPSIDIASDNGIAVITPPFPVPGLVDVTVFNAVGQVTAVQAFEYTQEKAVLTTEVSPVGSGTVSPSGVILYTPGEVVSVSAEANEGWRFDHWTIDGVAAGSAMPLVVTVDVDKTVTAVFLKTYTLMTGLTPPGGGTIVPVTGSYEYLAGETATVSAQPNEDWILDRWEVNGVPQAAAPSIQVTMDADKQVVAFFREFSVAGVVPNMGPVAGGNQVVVLGKFPVAGTITSVAEAAAAYSVYFHSGPTTAEMTFDASAPAVMTAGAIYAVAPAWATPALVGVAVATKVYPERAASRDGAYTYLNPPSITSITPAQGPTVGGTFVQIVGNALATVSGVYFGYDITPETRASNITVLTDSSISLVSPPAAAPGIVPVIVITPAGIAQGAFEYTEEYWTLTTEVTPIGSGTVSPPGITTYTPGTVVPVTATANDGWEFDHWTVNGVDAGTDMPLPVTMDGDKTVVAVFTGVQNIYNLTIAVDPAGGGVTNPVEGVYAYAEGAVAELSATPNTGWIFVHWLVDNQYAGSANPINITMDSDKVVTALFMEATYVLATAVLPPNSGTVTADPQADTYTHGQVVTLTATANAGWVFDHWTADFAIADAENPVLEVTMDADKLVTAFFMLPPAELSITPDEAWLFGGVTAEIRGADFTEQTLVSFGDNPAEIVDQTETRLLVVVPRWNDLTGTEAAINVTVVVDIAGAVATDENTVDFTYYRNKIDGDVMSTAFVYDASADAANAIVADVDLGADGEATLTLPVLPAKDAGDVYGLVRASKTPGALPTQTISDELGADRDIVNIWDFDVHLYEDDVEPNTPGMQANVATYVEIEDWKYDRSDSNAGSLYFPVDGTGLTIADVKSGLSLWAVDTQYDYPIPPAVGAMFAKAPVNSMYQSTLLADDVRPRVTEYSLDTTPLQRVSATLYDLNAFSLKRMTPLPAGLVEQIRTSLTLDPAVHPDGTASGPLAGGTAVRIFSNLGGLGYQIDRVVFGSAAKAFTGAVATIVEPRENQYRLDVLSPPVDEAGWVDIAIYPKSYGGAAIEPWILTKAFQYKAVAPPKPPRIPWGLIALLLGLWVGAPALIGGDHDSSPCFIATAAYGTPLADQIDTLRALRDTYLLNNGAGTAFVDFYYRVSPFIADIVAKSPVFAAMVRLALMPVIFAAKMLLAMPGPSFLLAMAAMASMVLQQVRGRKKA